MCQPKAILLLAIITGFLNFCARNPDSSQSQIENSYGSRQKTKVNNPASYPYSSIGHVGEGCVATLVAPSFGVTAGHCAVDEETGVTKKDFLYFTPNLQMDPRSVERIYIDRFWYGAEKPGRLNRSKDWVIFHLAKPIGETLKWLQVDGADIAKHLPYTVNLAGYSEDFGNGLALYEFTDCMILEVSPNPKDEGNLYHNCHTGLGSSGSPMFFQRERGFFLDAIHVSEKRKSSPESLHLPKYSFEFANIAIAAKEFAKTLSILAEITEEPGKVAPNPPIEGVFFAKNPDNPSVNVKPNTKPSSNGPTRGHPINSAVLMQRLTTLETIVVQLNDVSRKSFEQKEYTDNAGLVLLQLRQEGQELLASILNLKRSGVFQPQFGNRILISFRRMQILHSQLVTIKRTPNATDIESKLESLKKLLYEETQNAR